MRYTTYKALSDFELRQNTHPYRPSRQEMIRRQKIRRRRHIIGVWLDRLLGVGALVGFLMILGVAGSSDLGYDISWSTLLSGLFLFIGTMILIILRNSD